MVSTSQMDHAPMLMIELVAYEVVGAMGSGDKNGKRRRSDYAQTTTVTFRHSLLATCYSPLATRYLLLATCYLLPATCLLLHPAG